MIIQNYLLIENNIVTNNVAWDGNTQTWQPPVDAIMLVQSTTPAMVWTPILVDKILTDWALTEEIGQSQIGFTWDGTVCTTNQPKPAIST